MKPYAFAYLFETHSFDRIFYLDPDIRIYSTWNGAIEVLQSANIALTPHLTGSLDDDKRPGEIDILRSGAYNLGFIGISRSRGAAAFLVWWQQRLYDHCLVDLARGLFVDQKWIDLASGMFDGVSIVRDPGYNVAYWNLGHRVLSRSDAGYDVAGVPLRYFHFSGYDPNHPDKLSRHQNRFKVKDLSPANSTTAGVVPRGIFSQPIILLGPKLVAVRHSNLSKTESEYRIAGRPIRHEAPELIRSIENPFSDEGFEAFLEKWNSPIQEWKGGAPPAFPGLHTGSIGPEPMFNPRCRIFSVVTMAILEWMLINGKVEHGLGDVFLTTISDAIRTCKEHREALAWPETPGAGLSDDVVGEPSEEANGTPRLRLTRLAAAIYQSRAELQNYFPDPCGRDSVRFLAWLLTYGRKEHYLSPTHLAPLKAQWRSVVAGLPHWWTRAHYALVLRAMAASVHIRASLKRLPVRKARSTGKYSSPKEAPVTARVDVESPVVREYGVNLVGYFHSETGVGQSVRAARLALQTQHIPLSLRCAPDSGPSRKQDVSAGPMSSAFPYSTNLFYVNADQTTVIRKSLGEEFYRRRSNIGFWVWELDEFPEKWQGHLAAYQEIWTPSTFCSDAIGRKARVPVLCFPYSVAPLVGAGMDREYFGFARDKFLFLAAFDVLSVPERKNPLAAIRAFAKAFGSNSDCQIIIKVNHAHAGTNYIEMLRNECDSGSIVILDSTLSREEMNALTNCVDCVVSLHRSEGFGLLIAEAMYLGKPVIVTNYSGNTDFTRPENSMLVDYRMIPIGRNCAPARSHEPMGRSGRGTRRKSHEDNRSGQWLSCPVIRGGPRFHQRDAERRDCRQCDEQTPRGVA